MGKVKMSQNLDYIKHIPCPVERTVAIIGSKWSILIIRELSQANEPLRFNEILEKLKPISSRTLSLRLKVLKKYGVVNKTVISNTPLFAVYSLSESGQDIKSILQSMAGWSLKWYNEGL